MATPVVATMATHGTVQETNQRNVPDGESTAFSPPKAEANRKEVPVAAAEVVEALFDPPPRLEDLPEAAPPAPPAGPPLARQPGARKAWAPDPGEAVPSRPPDEFHQLLEELRRRSWPGRTLHEVAR